MTWVLLLLIIVGLAAAPVIAERLRKPMDGAARNSAPGEFFALTDGTTHVHYRGPVRGPLIVAVHGLTTSEYVWDDIAADLNDVGFRFVSYDLYGRGYSDRPSAPQDEAFFVRQLEEVLAEAGNPESVILMGYSMGASISVAYAAKHPDKVEKLILIAPAGMSDTVDGHEKFLRDTPMIGDWVVRVLGARSRRKRHAATRETDPKRVEFSRKQLAESDYRGFLPAVLSSGRHMLKQNQADKHRTLEEERVPTFAVWGEGDTVIPLTALGDMTQANRAVVHETVAGADHGLPYTHPRQVASAIKGFLLEG
ncbi:alpha/beta hydrolase [uncultured Litoreibacter sp.]|uniref:alpha/beta fold hydrolase n=1 Tax=uncultured Litoreibacter sp. TaxID=1392394 RepID=UPI0026147F2E|nr:alpha/beta hydrolase [uncultured Litoreibacter sp.]